MTAIDHFPHDLDQLSLHVEELEALDALDDMSDFFTGVGIGLGVVGLVVAGIAIT